MTTQNDNDKPTTDGGAAAPEAGAASGPEGAPPAEAAAPVETEGAKLAKAERERAELQDRLLRLAAEFENYKKRARRESDDAANRGREQLLKELLPVLDNLDRALTAVARGGSVEALGEGVRLVDKQFHSVLEKFDVKRFEALGQPFDPAKHEAIQQVESADVAPGAVATVFARGYTIGERLLRPAMVAVNKSAPRAAATEPAPSDGGDSGEAQ